MGERITQNSFTGGEIAPDLRARTDIAKYSISLAVLKNGFVRVQGGVLNRAGLEFVAETKDSLKKTRVIPFVFNADQQYITEAGDKYFRFIHDDGLITTDSTGNDVVETVTPYIEDELFGLKYDQDGDVLTICNQAHPVKELARNSHYNWSLDQVSFEPAIAAPKNGSATWTGTAGTTTYKYKVTAVKEETYEESNATDEIVVNNGRAEDVWAAAQYCTISWDAVDDAYEYNVYKEVNGIFGFIGAAQSTSFKDTKIEPDFSSTAPVFKNPFNGDGNYPAVVASFGQRKVFANTRNKPRSIFTTQTGTSNNMNISRPLIASDAITLTIREGQVNQIQNIIGSTNGLIAFTAGAEFKINGADGKFEASPPPEISLQSCYGSSSLTPVVSGNLMLFTQGGRSIVRDLGYTYISDSYDGSELTILANHLFEGKQIVDWAYSKEPYRILWAVMSDGTLNALTYEPKQESLGWHRHETKGEFESVAVIREGVEDVPYFVIKRKINGQTKRYIEKMKSRIIDDVNHSFFVDSGLSYSGSPVIEITGLDHLEGEEVIILADGGVVTGKTVKNGAVTLDREASVITIGLPYEFELKTLNIEGERSLGLNKKISNVSIKIHQSREDFFVVGSDGTETQLERSIESINDSNRLLSKDVKANPVSDWSTETYVHIKQPYPLPLTILAITPEVEAERS